MKKKPPNFIQEIEEKPSAFVEVINAFTLICSFVCYTIIAYLLIFHFELVKLFFTDYTRLQHFITPEYRIPIYIVALLFNIILSVNPFAQLVPLTQLISFFYGFKKGLIFAMLTVVFSYILTLYLARSLGENIVRKIIGKDKWQKVQILADEEGVFPFFIGHLFPVFPDAIVAWVAGTTKLSFTRLTVASTLARVPGIVITVLIGSGVIVQSPYLTVGLFIVLLLTSILLTRYRKQILRFMNKAGSTV